MADEGEFGAGLTNEEFQLKFADYRAHLVAAHQASVREYDKTVLTLAGGTLAISIAFIRDIAPEPRCSVLIVAGWFLLTVSIGAVVGSFATSQRSLSESMKEVDERRISRRPGGRWRKATTFLNVVGGATFFAGAILVVVFVVLNLPKGGP